MQLKRFSLNWIQTETDILFHLFRKPFPQDIMLPNDLFLNLINLELQNKIAISNDLDGNAAEDLKLLLKTAPTSMMAGLDDWTVDRTNGRNILFYKEKNYIPRNTEL